MLRVLVLLSLLAVPVYVLVAREPRLQAAESAGPASVAAEVQAAPEVPPPDPLEALFAAADASPAGLAPLIRAVCARIAQADGTGGHALAERLEPYCKRAFFGPERDGGLAELGVVLHRVRTGELPAAIAKRYGVGEGLLPLLNESYAPTRLRVGQELKLLDLREGRLRLVVDRERFRLGAWRAMPDGSWVLLAYLPVGLGALETPTPAGRTRIVERVLDPEWRDPATGVVYPPGDPGNYLGGYWMRLDPEGIGQQGIGLHGFTRDEPELWLGRNASNGCVRMLQSDMDRIFHLAVVGTPLEFVP